jgi:hypothetical protein
LALVLLENLAVLVDLVGQGAQVVLVVQVDLEDRLLLVDLVNLVVQMGLEGLVALVDQGCQEV